MIATFLSRQFLAFLFAGGVAALLHWLARLLLSQFLPFGWAVALAYSVGMTVAFVLNRWLVFPGSDKPVERQARDFIVINLAFFPIVWIVALLLNKLFINLGLTAYTEEVAHALAISLPVLVTFLLYKFYAFREGWHAKP